MESHAIRILGLMSGTSLDGLDLCLCCFWTDGASLRFDIEYTATVAYPDELRDRLKNCHQFSAQDILLLHNEYGRYCGQECAEFLKGKPQPRAIASHGHTVFHQPESIFTFQIGSGASIMAETGIDTICDFRSADVAFGGQGAPLVPIGDRLLFDQFDYCLNIGGFANISSAGTAAQTAYDICPANFVLNALTERLGMPYDDNGQIARGGLVNNALLDRLNGLEYYSMQAPKSLGREWVEQVIFPLLSASTLSTEDLISTFTEHIAIQIASAITGGSDRPRLIATGGGAHNSYLMEKIAFHSHAEICHVPDMIIDYKEALIFALLGYLYLQGVNNCLPEITGASTACIGGAMYKAPSRRK